MQRFHIHRFEFKYMLGEKEHQAIKKDLLQHMVYDPFALKNPDKAYMVFSLYCDDHRYRNFWDKVDGLSQRRKIRFRTYSSNPDEKPDVYLEIKQKKDMVIFKDRAKLDYSFYTHLSENGLHPIIPPEQIPLDQKKVIDDALFYVIRYNMTPKVLIVYKREAFFGKYHSNIRVTFDSEIKGYKTNSLFVENSTVQTILSKSIIMELKFRGSLPWWFHQIIQKYNLERISYSKYCRTLERCIGTPANFSFR